LETDIYFAGAKWGILNVIPVTFRIESGLSPVDSLRLHVFQILNAMGAQRFNKRQDSSTDLRFTENKFSAEMNLGREFGATGREFRGI
jgi:hypothetical protein